MSETQSAIDQLRKAVEVAGANPGHHYNVTMRSRVEWPALWVAIERLLDLPRERRPFRQLSDMTMYPTGDVRRVLTLTDGESDRALGHIQAARSRLVAAHNAYPASVLMPREWLHPDVTDADVYRLFSMDVIWADVPTPQLTMDVRNLA